MVTFSIVLLWVLCMGLNYKIVQGFSIAGKTSVIEPMSWLAIVSGPIGVFSFGAVMALNFKELITALMVMEKYINGKV